MTDLNSAFVATAIVVTASALWLRWFYGTKSKEVMNIPGNNGQWPILGDTMRLLNPRTMASYQVSSRRQWSSPVWRTSVLFKKCVFVSRNAHIKQLASQEISKRNTQACFPPHHKALFGEHSILVTSGEEHDRVRKVMSPVLQPSLYEKEIDMTAAAFVEDCLRHAEYNKSSAKSVHSEYFPMVPKIKQFPLSVALRIVLGDERWQEWDANATTNKALMLIEDFAIWSKGLLSAPTASIPFTPAFKAMQARGRMKQLLLGVIEEERKALKKNESVVDGTCKTAANAKVKGSLIRLLLREAQKYEFITEDVIVDNILTFLFAGHETSASILTSAFYELAKNSPLRKRLQSCIEYETKDGGNQAHDVDEVLLAFISEIQRMYPAAPFTMREIVKEGIDMGPELGTIPPGFLVAYSIAGELLNDETAYPNPKEFELDRWLIKKDSNTSSKPPVWAFGGGNRICPGRFLANAECIALLRLVLSQKNGFEWELKEDQNLDYQYNPGFFPVDDLLVKVTSNRNA